jgi:hypothetical protein
MSIDTILPIRSNCCPYSYLSRCNLLFFVSILMYKVIPMLENKNLTIVYLDLTVIS